MNIEIRLCEKEVLNMVEHCLESQGYIVRSIDSSVSASMQDGPRWSPAAFTVSAEVEFDKS